MKLEKTRTNFAVATTYRPMEQAWEQRWPLLSLTLIFMARIEKANSPRVLKTNNPNLSIQPSAANLKTTENYILKSSKDNKKVKLSGDRPRRATYLRKHCGQFHLLLYRVTSQDASLPLISPTELLYTETMSLFRKESNETYRLKCLHCKITTIFQKKNGICIHALTITLRSFRKHSRQEKTRQLLA